MTKTQRSGLARRSLAGVLALSAAVAMTTACAPAGGSEGKSATTALSLVAEPPGGMTRTFNPFSPTARWAAKSAMYEPLMIANPATGKDEPWLATDATWDAAGTALTVTLRDDVTWSDGEPFTASDVAFTFQLMIDNEGLVGPADEVLARLTSVEATDDSTVVLTFGEPFAPARDAVLAQFIVPEHTWSDVADPTTFPDENPVATGPYTVIENFSAQMYTLGRNPNYWQKLEVPALSLRSYSGNDQISAEVAAGNIDWGGLVPDPDKTFVPRDPEHNHYWWPQTRSVSLQVNTTKGALGDAGVRRALSMAVDRERIIDQAVWGKSDPANATALPEGGFSTWLDADVVDEYSDAVTLDVDAAAALLDDLGYAEDSDGVRHAPDGTALEYSIVIPTGWSDWITAAQVVAQDLTAVGVKVELQTIAYDSWADEVYNGEFDMTLYGMPSSPNPYSFYLGAMSQETLAPIGTQSVVNAHRFADPEATQLLQDYTAITDPDGQVAAMAGIEARFAELLPLIPLYNAPDFGLYTTTRFDGFPNEDDPYAPLSLQLPQKSLLVFPHLRTV